MSTYLVAFIVGEFDATPPVDAGTPLRIVHVPGKQPLTTWAQQIGAFSLKYFAEYYGLKYPGDKLDLIAIPDFASGAMENLGAITFRETALLADEKSASRAELERVADVVSHENAHMWFGDLVTMRWWNGIWLNEAFATFMEMLAVNAWKPDWKRWESFSVSRAAAMATDGLRSTRSIEYTVRSPEDCRAMFDILTYEKGASVLRMLEQYLGADGVSRRNSPLPEQASVQQHRDRRPVGRARGGVAPARAQNDGLVDLPARLSDHRGRARRQRPRTQALAAPLLLSRRGQPSALACARDGSREDRQRRLDPQAAPHHRRRDSRYSGQARMGVVERGRPRLLSRPLRAGAARRDYEQSRRAGSRSNASGWSAIPGRRPSPDLARSASSSRWRGCSPPRPTSTCGAR